MDLRHLRSQIFNYAALKLVRGKEKTETERKARAFPFPFPSWTTSMELAFQCRRSL